MTTRSRTVEHRPPREGRPAIEVVRSARRHKTASADFREGRLVVRLPAGMPGAEEEQMIATLVHRVLGRERAAALGGDEALTERAAELADEYLDGVHPTEVRWSSRMTRQWGSCTPGEGTVRINNAVAAFPGWVRDVVLLHELAHLRHARHTDAFHEVVARHPRAEEARGFLRGVQHARGRLATPGDPLRPDSDGNGNRDGEGAG